jgi:hypothetical protein
VIIDGEDEAGVAGDGNQAESVADAAHKVKILYTQTLNKIEHGPFSLLNVYDGKGSSRATRVAALAVDQG